MTDHEPRWHSNAVPLFRLFVRRMRTFKKRVQLPVSQVLKHLNMPLRTLHRPDPSREEVLHHIPKHIGKPKIATGVAVGEGFVIKSEQV